MKNYTFDTHRSANLRLHNKLSQQDEYAGYLKRVEMIVDKKYRQDRSPQFYMNFLNQSRVKSKQQMSLDKQHLIQLENKHLLEKIQREKNRKYQKVQSLYEVHYEEKRIREQDKINQQNMKMAKRIMNQNSYLINNSLIAFSQTNNSPDKGITKKRMTQLKFFDSKIKKRQLPKLMKSPSADVLESIS